MEINCLGHCQAHELGAAAPEHSTSCQEIIAKYQHHHATMYICIHGHVCAPALPDPQMEIIQGLGKLLQELVKWDTVAWKSDFVQPGKTEVLKGWRRCRGIT